MTDKIECGHCNGYGSSWNDEGAVRCSQCGGTGLVTGLSQPLSGVIYNLIAGPNTPAISNGNSWEESRVSNE